MIRVQVAGAGPVGLTAAPALARRGFAYVWKVKGHEFCLDASPGMSAGRRLGSVLHGVLSWAS